MRSAPRRCFALAGLVIAAIALTTNANAQSYPNRPIRIVVPFAAGGAVDTVGRIVAAKMSEHLGQPVIVENRPARVATSAPTPSRNRRPTATHCCSRPAGMPLRRRCTARCPTTR